jgi:hypothetical protein
LITTDECKACGDKKTFKYDLKEEKPITEEDRKKYCLQYVNGRTFFEDLKAIADLKDLFDEQQAEKILKEEYGVDKIERLSIPQIKTRLAKVCGDSGFTEFSTEKPNLGRNVILGFSVQDPSTRTEKESVKILGKIISKDLFNTNWRLQVSSVSYRLAYLTGKLKAYESEEDLLKLAMEIGTK